MIAEETEPHLSSLRHVHQLQQNLTVAAIHNTQRHMQRLWAPILLPDGSVGFPGAEQGLSLQAYRILTERFQRVLEADLRIQSAASSLSRATDDELDSPHWSASLALTPIQASPAYSGLFYKREDRTVTKAFKIRGAYNAMAAAMEKSSITKDSVRRFVSVSTGNHAMGLLRAAQLLQPEAIRIVVPESTAPVKKERLAVVVDEINNTGAVHAELLLKGNTFDDARNWVLANPQGYQYIDPYANADVVAGQGTLGLELVRQLGSLLSETTYKPSAIRIISPIGGGGLLTGIATAVRMVTSVHPIFQNIRMDMLGLRLANLNSPYGDAIRVKKIDPMNRKLMHYLGVRQQLVTDPQMAEAMAFAEDDLGLPVEGASAATLIPVMQELDLFSMSDVWTVAIISGANL